MRLVPPTDEAPSTSGSSQEAWVDRLGAGEIGRPGPDAGLLREMAAFATLGLHVVGDRSNTVVEEKGCSSIIFHPIDTSITIHPIDKSGA